MPSKQLPSSPSLDHLKHQAKDLLKARQEGNPETIQRIKASHPGFSKATEEEIRAAKFALSDAQLVIAREYGFESWPKLKAQIESVSRNLDPKESAFLEAACAGNQVEANNLLAEQPGLSRASVYAAAILGEADSVDSMLKRDPTLATRKGGPKDWDPLLCASASRFHRESEKRATGIVDVARVLLANGADPNTYFLGEGDEKSKQSALYLATCEANNAALARVLLEAGANPNDSESIYHAAERYHIECLELLAEFGVNVSDRIQPWNNTPLYFLLGHKPSKGIANQVLEGVRWLLEHGADPNVSSYEFEGRPIHLAASNGWGADMLELLLKHGADLNARRKDAKPAPLAARHVLHPDPVGLVEGKTAYALAAQYGHTHIVDWLREHGAQADLSPVEEFFAACGRGDEPAVRAMLAAQPELVRTLSDEDKQVLAFAAGDGKIEALRLMLLAGMPIDIRGDAGGTPLHQAAWWGQLGVVNLLLAHRAPLDVRDTSYDATPLGRATHGSVNCRNPQGDYPAVVEALIQAGAKVERPPGAPKKYRRSCADTARSNRERNQLMAITVRSVTSLFEVYNMHRSVAFYRDVLGFEVVQKYEPDGHFYWAMLKLGDATIMLNGRYEDDQRPPQPDAWRTPGHADTELYFDCPNVDEAYAHLVSKGCKVPKPEITHYGMRQLFISDPDGFKLCFQQRA